jgi:hypothetical protein
MIARTSASNIEQLSFGVVHVFKFGDILHIIYSLTLPATAPQLVETVSQLRTLLASKRLMEIETAPFVAATSLMDESAKLSYCSQQLDINPRESQR